MPKILTIVGARPQFVKAAALSRALKEQNMEEVLVHTGQHFDENMAEIFFREMEIPQPKYNLGINSVSYGANNDLIVQKAFEVTNKKCSFDERPYGEGNAAEKIAIYLKENLR